MKLLCFNLDDCGYVQHIPTEDLPLYNLEQPFVKCPECNSLAILTKDNFDPNKLDENLIFSSILKLSKRK